MTQAIGITGSLNNGVSSQLLANFNTSRSMATDLAGSIFNSPLPVTPTSTYLNGPGMGMGMFPGMGMGYGMGMYGMGYGMGMYNPLMMNQMYQQIQASNTDFQNRAVDKQSDWNVEHAWKNDVNNYQIEIKDEEFTNKIQQLQSQIHDNNTDAANQTYQELLRLAALKYNPETVNNKRLDTHNCMKAKVNQLYQQYTGSTIIDDIDQNCKDSTVNAWEDGRKLRLCRGHRLSKDTFKAVVTDQRENTVLGEGPGKKVMNGVVKTIGGVWGILTFGWCRK